ncbi:oligosaccharide flippase family protein, partial [Vibrio cyclitrophicus]|uniref:oligosaccharide flippase family protein n=1 Tax=Vibrio cyclitrophicus TaxID=47951 RepID=UPI0010567AB6
MISRSLIINSIWLVFDKCFILLGGLITTLVVARYLNPDQMGLINYAVIVSGLGQILSQWGARFTIFEYAAKNKNNVFRFISETFFSRLIIYVLTWGIFSVYLFFTENKDSALFISVLSLSMIFLALDIYQYFFDGKLLSKYNTIATFLGRFVSIVSRLILVYLELDLWFFLIPFALEGIIIIVLKLFIFKTKFDVDYNGRVATKVTRNYYFIIGTPVVIYSFLNFFYDKIN